MQFLDLTEHHAAIEKEALAALATVFKNGDFINGKAVSEFEKAFATHHGVSHALGMNSGTDALVLGLEALGIGAGDEVITSAFTFFATAEAIAQVGATPVFVDIDPATFNINPALVEKAITPKTRAILPVHIFGQPAHMDELMLIAKNHNLKVVEDACQAVGAEYKGKKVGGFGDVGCFSFFPSKNLGACGDGGIATTNSPELAAQMKLLKSHGSSPQDKYFNIALGYNTRLDTMQAAILAIKLPHLNEYNEKRAVHAQAYNEALSKIGDCVVPVPSADTKHVYHQYTFRTSRRDELKKHLDELGIPTMIYYRVPLHLQPVLKYLGYAEGSLPETERACKEVISLPIYPELSAENRTAVIEAIRSFFA